MANIVNATPANQQLVTTLGVKKTAGIAELGKQAISPVAELQRIRRELNGARQAITDVGAAQIGWDANEEAKLTELNQQLEKLEALARHKEAADNMVVVNNGNLVAAELLKTNLAAAITAATTVDPKVAVPADVTVSLNAFNVKVVTEELRAATETIENRITVDPNNPLLRDVGQIAAVRNEQRALEAAIANAKNARPPVVTAGADGVRQRANIAIERQGIVLQLAVVNLLALNVTAVNLVDDGHIAAAVNDLQRLELQIRMAEVARVPDVEIQGARDKLKDLLTKSATADLRIKQLATQGLHDLDVGAHPLTRVTLNGHRADNQPLDALKKALETAKKNTAPAGKITEAETRIKAIEIKLAREDLRLLVAEVIGHDGVNLFAADGNNDGGPDHQGRRLAINVNTLTVARGKLKELKKARDAAAKFDIPGVPPVVTIDRTDVNNRIAQLKEAIARTDLIARIVALDNEYLIALVVPNSLALNAHKNDKAVQDEIAAIEGKIAAYGANLMHGGGAVPLDDTSAEKKVVVRLKRAIVQRQVTAQVGVVDALLTAVDRSASLNTVNAGGIKAAAAASAELERLSKDAAHVNSLVAAGIGKVDAADALPNRIKWLKLAIKRTTLVVERGVVAGLIKNDNGVYVLNNTDIEVARAQLAKLDTAIHNAEANKPKLKEGAGGGPRQDAIEQRILLEQAINNAVTAQRTFGAPFDRFREKPQQAQEKAQAALAKLAPKNRAKVDVLNARRAARLEADPTLRAQRLGALREAQNKAATEGDRAREEARTAIQEMQKVVASSTVAVAAIRQKIRATEYLLFVEGARVQAADIAANVAVESHRLGELVDQINTKKGQIDAAPDEATRKSLENELRQLTQKAWRYADQLATHVKEGKDLAAKMVEEKEKVLGEVPADNDILDDGNGTGAIAVNDAIHGTLVAEIEIPANDTNLTNWRTALEANKAIAPLSIRQQVQGSWNVEERRVRAEFEMCQLLQYSPANIAGQTELWERYKAAMAVVYPEVDIDDGATQQERMSDIKRYVTRFFERDVTVRTKLVRDERDKYVHDFRQGEPSYRFKQDIPGEKQAEIIAKISRARELEDHGLTVVAVENEDKTVDFYVVGDGDIRPLGKYIDDQVKACNDKHPADPRGSHPTPPNPAYSKMLAALTSAASDPRYISSNAAEDVAIAGGRLKHEETFKDLFKGAAEKRKKKRAELAAVGADRSTMLINTPYSDLLRVCKAEALQAPTTTNAALRATATAVSQAYAEGKIRGREAEITDDLVERIHELDKHALSGAKISLGGKDYTATEGTNKKDKKEETVFKSADLEIIMRPVGETQTEINWKPTENADKNQANLDGIAAGLDMSRKAKVDSVVFELGEYEGEGFWDFGDKKRDKLEAQAIKNAHAATFTPAPPAPAQAPIILVFMRHEKSKASTSIWETYKSLCTAKIAAADKADTQYLDLLFKLPECKQEFIGSMCAQTGAMRDGEMAIWDNHTSMAYTQDELMQGYHKQDNGTKTPLSEAEVKRIIEAQALKKPSQLEKERKYITRDDAPPAPNPAGRGVLRPR